MISKYRAWLNINRECNLRCLWCYAQGREFNKALRMDMAVANKAISFLSQLEVDNIILIGGEPTLHCDLFKIINAIKKKEVKASVITNGILFSDKDFVMKAECVGLDLVNVSIKASSGEGYKRFAGVDAFNDVIKAIELICRSSIRCNISLTVTGHGVDGFGQLLTILSDVEIGLLMIDVERPIFLANNIQPTKDELKIQASVFEDVFELLEGAGIEYKLAVRIPFCFFREGFVEGLISRGRIVSGCQLIGGSGVIIDTDARLLPCNQMYEYPLGQLGVDFETAEEYLKFRESSEVFSFYRVMKSCPSLRCVNCQYWAYCGGGCRMLWLGQAGAEML